MLMVGGILSTAGRAGIGLVADRVGAPAAGFLSHTMSLMGTLCVGGLDLHTSLPLVIGYVLFLFLPLGTRATRVSILVARIAPPAKFGSVFGWLAVGIDLIVSAAGPAAPAVKNATSTIPIVLATSFYPVEQGLIASLRHPGGNITGVTHFTPELMAKRVQLLKELLPRASRFALLRLPGTLQDLVVRDMEAAARQLGAQLQVVTVQRGEDLAAAFDTAVGARAQAIMSTQSPFFVHHNAQIAQLALKHRLPSLSGEPGAADDGALLFYGPDIFAGCGRAAMYVDRILKGARPADLPVEQPTKIDFVINLKTARALKLTIPQSLLLRADRVIQ
jgi:putative ABC transport system substrate-binding protein